jgi:hypothetical protein
VTRTERPYFRIAILLLLAVVAALAAYLTMAQRMADPDQFWHIATGRWIVQNGAVPTHDVFSWWAIANNREWVAQEWLFGILIYGVYAFGGFVAVYWFASVLEGATIFVVYALVRARRVDPLWALLVTIASMFGTIYFVAPRPQMLSFVLIPLTALLMEKGRWPWALAVMVLGVNVHGGLWPLYVLVFALYEFPRRWWLVGLAVVAALATPQPIANGLHQRVHADGAVVRQGQPRHVRRRPSPHPAPPDPVEGRRVRPRVCPSVAQCGQARAVVLPHRPSGSRTVPADTDA